MVAEVVPAPPLAMTASDLPGREVAGRVSQSPRNARKSWSRSVSAHPPYEHRRADRVTSCRIHVDVRSSFCSVTLMRALRMRPIAARHHARSLSLPRRPS